MSWKIDVDLGGMVDQFAELETHDGIVREGRISRVLHGSIEINGKPISLPKAIELNGDVGDVIDFVLIRRMKLR